MEVKVRKKETNKYSGKNDRKVFAEKLRDLGYPEATAENGLLLKLKSYASCLVNHMTKEPEAEQQV